MASSQTNASSPLRQSNGGPRALSVREALLVWSAFALVTIVTVVTYARLEPEALYNVTGSGLAGGLGRALVYLNFPVSLAAIAVVGVVLERLPGALYGLLGAIAVAFCLVTTFVVDQSDLDARAVNAVPAVGVALALVLTALALRRGGLGSPARRSGLDVLRAALGLGVLLLALPWIFAAFGGYVGHAPAIGRLFISAQHTPEPGHPALRGVHLGLHHGLDGTLLVLTALLLTRNLTQLVPSARRTALVAYLSLLLFYGLANLANDAWDEQVVKRGWAATKIPDMLLPAASPAWLAMLAAAACVAVLISAGLARASKGVRSRAARGI
jgi:hypothetical protein